MKTGISRKIGLFLAGASLLLQACTTVKHVEVLDSSKVSLLAHESEVVVLAETTNAIGHSKRSFFNLLPIHETMAQKHLLTADFRILKSYRRAIDYPLLRLKNLDLESDYWTPFHYCLIGYDLSFVGSQPKNLRFMLLRSNNLPEITAWADEQFGLIPTVQTNK